MGEIARKFMVFATGAAYALLFASSAAFGAGLGRLNVQSALGEPLRAEIEIVSLQAGESDSLTVKLASNQAYRQANIDLNGALLGVKFSVERRASNQYVVALSSVQPMNEPFIDMLVELTWSAGRLVREYTFLLDPPGYKAGTTASVPAVEPPAVQATPVPATPAAPVATPVQPATPAPAAPSQAARPAKPAAAPLAPAQKPAGTYEVRRGDTLARIAEQNRVEGASLQQMLVALYKNNPDAFDGENMNRLRAGRILNLPDREAVTAVSAGEARSMVSAQSADYGKYRSSLGAAVAAAPARAESGRQTSGRVGAPADEKAAAPKDAPTDQLRLSRPEDAKAAGKGAAAKAAASDDAAAKDKALKEANERIALLEKNIAAMKSAAGAQMQQQAQAAKADAAKTPAAPAKPEAAKADAGKPEAAKPDAAKPEAAKPEAAKPEAPKPEAAKADAAKADAAKAEAAPDAAKADVPKAPDAAAPKAAPKPVPPPPPPPETSFFDQLLDDPMTVYGGAGVILLLAGYAFYAVRKKRKQAAAASSTIANTVEPTFANSMLASTGESHEEAAEAAPAEAGVVSDATPVVAPESEEIDPVAEADVYMAYGRDSQAEEILKEALAKDSSRQQVRLKLMEIYANRKDKDSFAAAAQELHAATGGQGADWDKAASLGASIDPDNPLYAGGAAMAGAGTDDTQILPGADADLTVPAPDLVLDAEPAETAAPAAVDFDLDAPAPVAEEPAVPAPAAESAPAALDFDLDLGGDKPADVAPVEEQPAESAPADAGLSIDFELPDMTAAAAPAEPVAEPASDAPLTIDFDLGSPEPAPAQTEAAPALDLSSISLDLGTLDAGATAEPNAHWQEVATKLDLAKAYQDMGDKDGARELLNEVIKEGDDAQQGQARTMLEAIG